MDRIPNQLGYLVLTMDGAVIASDGDLENNERIADIISKLITTGKFIVAPQDQYHDMSIIYQKYRYQIWVSNKKIHVSKIKHEPCEYAFENNEVKTLLGSS